MNDPPRRRSSAAVALLGIAAMLSAMGPEPMPMPRRRDPLDGPPPPPPEPVPGVAPVGTAGETRVAMRVESNGPMVIPLDPGPDGQARAAIALDRSTLQPRAFAPHRRGAPHDCAGERCPIHGRQLQKMARRAEAARKREAGRRA
jgi:hypothetical protein